MSFDRDDILEELAEATGGRREFFSSDGYSFRRLAKLEGIEPELAAKLRSRRWKLLNPERSAELKRASLERLKVTDLEGQRAMRRRRKQKWETKNRVKVLAMSRRANAAAKAKDPEIYRAAALARAKAAYEKTKLDPAKLEALRAYKREWARQKKLREASR